jgi:hypothetical protein
MLPISVELTLPMAPSTTTGVYINLNIYGEERNVVAFHISKFTDR